MYLRIPEKGYNFTSSGIKKIEETYDARYMGWFAIKRSDGRNWNERPVDIFYQPNADKSKGHSDYFGMYVQGNSVYILDGASAFSEPMYGIVSPDGEVTVSRCIHDFRPCPGTGVSIDGGRDYVRLVGNNASNVPKVHVRVVDGEFVFDKISEPVS